MSLSTTHWTSESSQTLQPSVLADAMSSSACSSTVSTRNVPFCLITRLHRPTHSPTSPEEMDWSTHYPSFFPSDPSASSSKAPAKVEWADIGCGFGGLLMALAPMFPDTLMLGELGAQLFLPFSHAPLLEPLNPDREADRLIGMEIRTAVTAYVGDRIAASRQHQLSLPPDSPERIAGGYQNVSVIRANSMKHIPNFFAKGQVGHHGCSPFHPFSAHLHHVILASGGTLTSCM